MLRRGERIDLPELESIHLGFHAFSFDTDPGSDLIMRSDHTSLA